MPLENRSNTSAYSDVENMVLDMNVRTWLSVGSLVVTFTPTAQMGDRYFAIYLNGLKRAHVFAEEGQEAIVAIPLSATEVSESLDRKSVV